MSPQRTGICIFNVMESVINCAAYCDGHRVANVELDAVHDNLSQPGQFVWVGLHEPSTTMLQKLQSEFGLHDLSIEDAHRAHQRPKIETYGETLFIVLRTIEMKEKRIE